GDLSLLLEPDEEGGAVAAGRVKMELGGTLRGLDFDAINVAGSLIYGGTLEIALLNDFAPLDGASFDLFDGFSDYEGTFANITFSSSGYAGMFDPATGVLTVATVPEPTVFGLAMLGLGITGMRRRTRAPRA